VENFVTDLLQIQSGTCMPKIIMLMSLTSSSLEYCMQILSKFTE